MRSLKRLCKAALLVLLNLLFTCIGLLISLLPDGKRKLWASTTGMSKWAQYNCILLGIRIRKNGPHCIPKGSFIVANHCSYIDILVLGSLIPAVFVAKKEVAGWPVLGLLSRWAGTVFIDRDSSRSALTLFPVIEDHLTSNISVILFPEGTTNNGKDILAFKSSFFKIPVKKNVPVQPVSLMYSHIDGEPILDVKRDEIAWYGSMSLLPHLWNILGMQSIDVGVRFNPEIYDITTPDSAVTRKKVSLIAHESIRAGYESLLANGQSRQLNLEL